MARAIFRDSNFDFLGGGGFRKMIFFLGGGGWGYDDTVGIFGGGGHRKTELFLGVISKFKV